MAAPPPAPKADAAPTGKPFSDNSYFNAFKDSIEDWATNCQLKVTNALAYMIKQETPSGMTGAEASTLVLLVLPEAKFLGVANTAVPIIIKAFKGALKSKSPTVNDIHKAWTDGMDVIKRYDKTKWFEAFLKEWKSENSIKADEKNDITSAFNRACLDYAKNHFPSDDAIQKSFVIELIKNVDDTSWDFDSESGYVNVFFALNVDETDFSKDRKKYYLKTCGIKDASAQLLQSLKTVFSGSTLIDLPLKIKVEVGAAGMGVGALLTTNLEFERTSKTPGNTSYKVTSKDQKALDLFLATGLLQALKVKDMK